jgi:hypothetical protein
MCVAARLGARRHIPVFASHDQLICTTHCRWIGNSELACTVWDQFTLADCPDILAVNRAHKALIQQWGRGPARISFEDATRCLSKWSEWRVVMQTSDIQRRRRRLAITDNTPWPHPKVVSAWYPTLSLSPA